MKARGTRIMHPEDIYPVVKNWAKRKEENFLTVTLNGSHEVIGVHHITKGLVNRTIVHPRECFYPAIKDYATSVVFVHNHPSGNATPSCEDHNITQKLCQAACILGFNFMDHLIIAPNGVLHSMRRENEIHDNFSDSDNKKFVGYLVAEMQGKK